MAGERGAAATIGAIGSVVAIAAVAIFAYMSTTAAKRSHDAFAARLDATDVKLAEANKALAALTQTTLAGYKQDLTAIEGKIKSLGDTLVEIQKSSASAGITKELESIAAKVVATDKALSDMRSAQDAAKALAESNGAKIAATAAATDKALSDMRSAQDAAKALAESNGAKIAETAAATEKALSDMRGAQDAAKAHAESNVAKLDKAVSGLATTTAAQAKTLETINISLAGVSKSLDAVKADAARAEAARASVASRDSSVNGAVDSEKNLVVVYLPNSSSPAASDPASAAPLSVPFDKIGSTQPAVNIAALANDLKKIVKDRKGCTVSVAGYADTLGSDSVNLQVSRERAKAVADQLRTSLAGQNIQVKEVAWGERQLKVWTRDGKSEKANRRVDVNVECGS